MKDILLFLAFLPLIPLMLRAPFWGIIVWQFFAFVYPQSFAYGFARSIPFSTIIFLCTAVGWIFTKDRQTPFTPLSVAMLFFYGWFMVSSMNAIFPDQAIVEIERFSKIIIVMFLTISLTNTKKKLFILIACTAVFAGLLGAKGGVFSLLTGGSYRVLGPPNSFIAQNNEFGMSLAMTIPLLFFFYSQIKVPKYKKLMGVFTFLVVVAAITTYSRGTFVSLVVILVMFLWSLKNKVRNLTILGVIFAIGLSFAPDSLVDRMNSTKSYKTDDSFQGRVNAWYFAVNLAKDYPLMGGGPRVFQRSIFHLYAPDPEDYHNSHSIYFQIIAEMGYVGFLIYFSIVFAVYLRTLRLSKHYNRGEEKPWEYYAAWAFRYFIVVFLVEGLVVGAPFYDYYYQILAMVSVLTLLTKRENLDKEENKFNKRALN